MFLKAGVGARGRNLHLSREGLLHVLELGKDISTLDLLFIELADSITVGGQAGEGNRPLNQGPRGASTSTLNNLDLGDAESVTMSDQGVLHLRALFSRSLQLVSDWDLLSLGLLAGGLLLSNSLLLGRQGRAGLLNTIGKGCSLGRLSSTRLSSSDISTLVSIVITTESTVFSISDNSGFHDLNILAIKDNSDVRSFQNNNIIRVSEKIVINC